MLDAIQVNEKSEMGMVFPLVTNDLFRLGREADGGYVLPKGIFKEIDLILSLGIGDDWSFEKEASEMLTNAKIIGCDFTITKKSLKNLLFKKLIKFFIGEIKLKDIYDQLKFNQKYNSFYGVKAQNLEKRISNRDEGIDITLEKILEDNSEYQNILLKMDIEGGEYYTINSIIKNRNIIPLACIEFHNCATLNKSFFSYLKKLKKYYDITHTHINNEGGYIDFKPEVYEITFQRKDISLKNKNISSERISLLPDKLDKANNPSRIEYKFKLVDIKE